MSVELWIGLATANFIACVSPGPNVALIVGTTLGGGCRRGLAAAAGVLIAEAAWAFAALAAIAGLLIIEDGLFGALQTLGALVLLGFGACVLRDAVRGGASAERRTSTTAMPTLMSRGFCVGLANPLALIFFIAVFPQFMADGQVDIAAIAICVSAVVASAALGLAPYLAFAACLTRRSVAGLLNGLSGAAMIGLAFGLMTTAG